MVYVPVPLLNLRDSDQSQSTRLKRNMAEYRTHCQCALKGPH